MIRIYIFDFLYYLAVLSNRFLYFVYVGQIGAR